MVFTYLQTIMSFCHNTVATGEHRLEVAVFEGGGLRWLNISGRRGRPPPTICAWIDASECLKSLPLKVFTQRNSVADFLREKPIFYTKKGKEFAFEAPFGGLRATYDVHLRLIGKLVGDFLLVIIELFSLGAFVLSEYTRLTDRQTDRQTYVDSNTVRICFA